MQIRRHPSQTMPLHFRRPSLPWLLWGALAAALLWLGTRTAGRLRDAADLVQASEPLQRPLAQPRARLLIVGDSTAVGTGASTPQASLAGLLARTFPGLAIENCGRDGATFADIPRQLAGGGRFDVVLIQAGGNDVIQLRDLDAAGRDIRESIRRAGEQAALVVVMPAGNVGNAPFFFPPISWLMSWRARRLHQAVRDATGQLGAGYVNLYKDRDVDPFAQQAELNARDGLHPSDAGYRVWLGELLLQSRLTTVATPATEASVGPAVPARPRHALKW